MSLRALGISPKKISAEGAAESVLGCDRLNFTTRGIPSSRPILARLQHPQPRGCGVQDGLRAVLQHSASPIPLFEHEDEHEHDFDAPCER
jgi:hypothetical protein